MKLLHAASATRKPLLAGTLAVVFSFTTFLSPIAEANFWAERREATRRFGTSPGRGVAVACVAPAGMVFPEMNPGLPTAVSQGLPDRSPAVRRLGALSGSAWLRTLFPYGDLGEVYLSPRPKAPWVIHIQDAHGIEDAQRNVASLIQSLSEHALAFQGRDGRKPGEENNAASLIGVEGAAGAFDLAPYRAYPAGVVKDVADFFLKKGLITGSEYAGLTVPQAPALFGVEKPELYQGNVQALRDAYKLCPQAERALQRGVCAP